jgi:iron complex outermembrane receptor protein
MRFSGTIDMQARKLGTAGLLLGALMAAASGVRGADDPLDLLDLSLEELANLRVTTVSRVEEYVRDTAASVFVITGDEIQRSGVTSIPEALRLAPGVEVARRGAHAWSITLRGFNSDLANKLLVLIDGRSVYSPLYAGVFWDVQDTLLEDIDRIEVIAGPGGTLWGANAVNGVINIITKPAGETNNGYAEFGMGNEEQGTVSFRHGGTLGQTVDARVYVKLLNRDASERATGADAIDGLRLARSGFRLDWDANETDLFTLQGDAYSGDKDGEFIDEFSLGTLPAGTSRGKVDLAGGNLLGRWSRELGDASDLKLQFYYDYTRRDIPRTYAVSRDTLDIDFQHHFVAGNRHEIVWGAGFRGTSDELRNSLFSSFEPEARTDRTWSAFFQDQIELTAESLFLTVGSKIEENDYTGSELQPNLRLSWRIGDRSTLWSAVSRAVRIPSRLDADLRLTLPVAIPSVPFPVYVIIDGTDTFRSEKLLAREFGFRNQMTDGLSLDVALFRNAYDRLQTAEPDDPVFVLTPPNPYVLLPNTLENGLEGTASGGTIALNWQPRQRFRTRFQYSRLDIELLNKPGSVGSAISGSAGNSPKHQLAAHSFIDLPHELSLYLGLRYVDELPDQAIENYTAVDMSLRWRFAERLGMSFTVRNLNDDHHPEFSSGGGNAFERDALLRILWTY